jgi:hypothetical protein
VVDGLYTLGCAWALWEKMAAGCWMTVGCVPTRYGRDLPRVQPDSEGAVNPYSNATDVGSLTHAFA